MKKVIFSTDEYYHIYNRGVDKRIIFQDPDDVWRFLLCLEIFNNIEITGSIFESTLKSKGGVPNFGSRTPKVGLVSIVAYCLNQNHFHLILKPAIDGGIQKFMHRLGTGYTNYFNEKNKRSGSLFQGKYRAKHISSNDYLLHLGVYVNLNDRVHKDMNMLWMKDLPFSSFDEYTGKRTYGICEKGIILDQFKDVKDFLRYCDETLPLIQQRKQDLKDFEDTCID
jgi:putative transposase